MDVIKASVMPQSRGPRTQHEKAYYSKETKLLKRTTELNLSVAGWERMGNACCHQTSAILALYIPGGFQSAANQEPGPGTTPPIMA